MNKRHLLLPVLTLVLFSIKLGFTQEPVLPGVGFVSPNGRYCVQLEVTDGFLRFVIKDTKTDRVDDSIQSTGPVYLRWASNSKSFVTVEHISKGSYGRVVYLADNRWSSAQIEPPFEGKKDFNVINLQLEPDRVHYKFAVTKLSDDWTPVDHSFCALSVSLATGKLTDVNWTAASETELVNMPGPDEPVCVPPMTLGTSACAEGPR